MAAIGSGINPALGRIDYSPFLQGAQMAAQGRMQGSAALTEGISKGFQDYLKKREQNAILEGKNNALLREISQNPQLASSPDIQKYTSKMANGGPLTLNDNIKLNAELTTTVEAVRNRQEQERQQAYLKLQQDAAAINAERAAREKAEYTRRNTFQENIIRLAKENPDVLKDPKMAVQAVLSAGGNYEDAQRIQGNAITQQQFDLELTQRNMDLAKRSLELAEAARRGEVTGKEPDVRVFEQNGVKMVVLLDALKQPIGQPHVIAQAKPSVGEKTQRNALEYHIAETRGDTAGMQRAMIDIIADNPEATRNLSQQEIRQNFILPFVPRVGGEVAPTEPLKVTGAPKPVSAPPAPSPEAARITQSPNVAPSATPASPPQPSLPSGPAPVTQIPNEDGLSAYVDQMRKGFYLTDRDPLSGLMPKSGGATQSANPYGTGSGAFRDLNLGGPPSRGAQPLIPQSIESSSIPFGPAAMDSTFLDREAQATDRGAYRPFDAAMAERYQTPAQGAIPQIKLSPAAQKIASELRKSAQSGERGKAPQFFLEASTGDDGKRTRIKLSQRDLDLFLSRTPDLRGGVRTSAAESDAASRSYGQRWLRQSRAR